VKTAKRGATVRRQLPSKLHGMFVQPFCFLSYYFLELNMMISFFNFQELYNSRLRERYKDDFSTHSDFNPDLWIEAGSSGGPNKNQVYGLSNTTTENLRAARNVSTVNHRFENYYFLPTELATEYQITDECYLDRRIPSVKFTPTEW
jgi:hypothetical protein